MNKLTLRFCPFLLLVAPVLSPSLQAQPKITGVLNAASYAVPGLPHSDIAQGSMFVVFGQNLAQGQLVLATAPFSTELGGCSIQVSGGGVTADAVLIYTSFAQVAAILPSRIPPGDATIAVTYRFQPDPEKTSAPARIRVARSSFGIFTRNQAGSGPGIVQNYNSATDQPVNALTAPVRPGQVMILWGTGLGPVTFDETQLPKVGDLDVEAEVFVGNKSARILYKGRSPQFPGIDQINFEVPADAADGCHVPLAVRAGGVVSNFASIAIAAAGAACSDAIGYSAADMEKLRSPGRLQFGEVVLVKTTVIDLKASLDEVSANFIRFDQATALKTRRLGSEPGDESRSPYGACAVASGRASAGSLSVGGDPTRAEPLPGGPSINLQGPRGAKQIAGNPSYSASLGGGLPGFSDNYGPEYLVPGLYTVDHQAGPIGAGTFRATLTLPAPIQWTNQDSFSVVQRAQDLTVTWTGGDPAKEYVLVGAMSFDTTREVGAGITCVERASAGRFTIPAWLLSTLPASGLFPGTSLPKGIVSVSTLSIVEPARFQAQGIDVGYFGYSLKNFKLAAFQ
jgi:uncharacterized protein (TIGR03437 family)